MTRVVCTSDTHNRHKALTIPSGDVFIHAGDLTMSGDMKSIRAGFAWMQDLPHRRVLFVPGNHDFAFERMPEFTEATVFRSSMVACMRTSRLVTCNIAPFSSPL
jgi:predicted phosphohydrolase